MIARALVLYHSVFGNTREVAMSLADGIRKCNIETECMDIDTIDISRIPEYGFMAIGGPTHMIGLSKDMKSFLTRLESLNLKGMCAFSFDTRNQSRLNQSRFLFFENSAARRIESRMKRLGMKIIQPRVSASVIGREGPLENGFTEEFFRMGQVIGEMLQTQLKATP